MAQDTVTPTSIKQFWDTFNEGAKILGWDRPGPPVDLAQAIRDHRQHHRDTPAERRERLTAALSAERHEPEDSPASPHAATSGAVPEPPDFAAAIRAARSNR